MTSKLNGRSNRRGPRRDGANGEADLRGIRERGVAQGEMGRRLLTSALMAGGLFVIQLPGEARNFRVNMIPNGPQLGCAACHVSPAGGGPRNLFGQSVGALVAPGAATPFWSPTLAALDSDSDGFTNGEELGDPDGDGTPAAGSKATNPGLASSKPVAANKPPTVALSGLIEGDVLVAPAIAAIFADAVDADGSVARVEFFSNGKSLGALTAAPFSLLVDWALGAHSVTAIATDNKGATTTSAAITMSVSAPEPTQLAAPVLSGGAVKLQWTGGGGPFAVQGRAAVSDPWCTLTDFTTNRAATVPARGVSGLIQIADLATGGTIPLTVTMAGAYERPNPVAGAGTGGGSLKLQGNTLTFDLRYSGLSGAATAAHFHGLAGVDDAAGVLIDLAPFNGGAFGTSGTLAGSVILTPTQKAAFLSGKIYANVHTAANKSGEIRGQVQPVLMQATLAGANERPTPVSSAGGGGASFLLEGDQLTFSVTYSGLSGPATAAHIHGPADADNAAGVMIDLAPFNGGAFGAAGSLAGTVTLTPAQFSAVASGRAYVNVHTDANRAGEIRGQIVPCATAIPFSVTMNGAAEKPNAVVTDGTGSGILALEGNALLFSIRYGGLSGPATAAHIHGPADVNTAAGVLIDLKPFNGGAFGRSGTLAGSVVLTATQRDALLGGLTYVNVHTDANKSGEIRGQATTVVSGLGLPGGN